MASLRFLPALVTALLIVPAAAQEGPDLNDIPAKIVKNTANRDIPVLTAETVDFTASLLSYMYDM